MTRQRFSSRRRSEWFWGYTFIAPTVIGLVLFLIAPIFFSIYISLTKWDNLSPPIFVGLQNYAKMLGDGVFRGEIRNTLVYTFVSVPLIVVFSILIASLLNLKIRGVGFFRAALFIPYVTLPAAAAMVWENMFHTKFGMINGFLKMIGLPRVNWLSDTKLVMGIIIAMGVWTSVGYYCIILLVGIKNLPASYYEAAKIDGATGRQSFVHITVPLLTPQIFFVTTMAIINAFKMFDAVFIFGKNSFTIRDGIRTMVYGIYERGFTYQDMGYASANAIVLLVIILSVTVLQFLSQKYWVHYE